jgi:hypothetical protein
MLIFGSQEQIDAWCEQHHIKKGDVQSISRIWQFAKVWYENHLNPDWTKWTNQEARDIFDRFGLTGPIWEVPATEARF